MIFRIGQHVFVGWHPDHLCHARRARCTPGIITDGPFPPGLYEAQGRTFRHAERTYVVETDGGRIRADEDILFPIDDKPETVERRQEAAA